MRWGLFSIMARATALAHLETKGTVGQPDIDRHMPRCLDDPDARNAANAARNVATMAAGEETDDSGAVQGSVEVLG